MVCVNSVQELLKEWHVEGIDLKKHAAEGNVEAFSSDVAAVLLCLFVSKSREKVIEHAPETVKHVAGELQKAKLVRLTESKTCEMVEPSVGYHFGFLAAIGALGLYSVYPSSLIVIMCHIHRIGCVL